MSQQRNALFLSHGGGPLPLLGDEAHSEMVSCLQRIAASIPRPSAIVVVSAHWEAAKPTLTAGARPELIYDYYGFPPESYDITYPCVGHPALAQRIAEQLRALDIDVCLDADRGFDHGLFVPLKIMYPQADIPCVQLSLLESLDPAQHIAMGRALQGLNDPSILLIGSGFSFHNMKAFFAQDTEATRSANQAFDHWLQETCGKSALSEAERERRLLEWESAPSARYSHPREEHLLPLHVCYGFTESACTTAYQLQILNKQSSMFLWQCSINP